MRGGGTGRPTASASRTLTARVLADVKAEAREEVTLTDWDPEGELKVAAAVLYAASDLPDDQLLEVARTMTPAQREEILLRERGRARRTAGTSRAARGSARSTASTCSATSAPTATCSATARSRSSGSGSLPSTATRPRHQIDEAGLRADWDRVMGASAAMEHALLDAGMPEVAQYAVAMAYRIRFVMQMTAREAMHLTELRSQPAGHPVYRRVAQTMHRLIDEVAGHHAIASTFSYVSYDDVDLERLEAERRTEAKRRALTDGK